MVEKQFYHAFEILEVNRETAKEIIEREFPQFEEELVERAVQERDNRAHSYRDFKVGAAILSKEADQPEGTCSITSEQIINRLRLWKRVWQSGAQSVMV